MIKNKIILRNEAFGGVYFNQENGRMVMVDREGFLTLIKYLQKKILNEKEKNIKELLKSSTTKRFHLYIFLGLLAVTLIGIIRLIEISLSESLWFLFIMCSLIVLDITMFFLNYRKSRKFEPNKML